MPQVTISIPNGQWPDFQKYYLLKRPVPLDGEGQPTMTVADWVKEGFVNDTYQILLAGKQMEALTELRDEITIDIT